MGNVVLGGTAGAGDDGTPPFSGLLDRGADAALFGPELFGGWFTCSRFLRVTSSVLRLLRRCWRCTASFEDEASETENVATVQLFHYSPARRERERERKNQCARIDNNECILVPVRRF